MKKKLAAVFPGLGYHVDRPLLYYSKKIAAGHGFEILDVPYEGLKTGIRGNSEKMMEAFEAALSQSEEILKDRDLSGYDTVLFLSKSIGTAVAAAYAARHQIKTRNVFFTPVKESFPLMKDDGIIFHGTADPWLDDDTFLEECSRTNYPYYMVEGANHSLETGDVLTDLDHLRRIMGIVENYVADLD